ncbi:MAG: hypothetical protein GC206_13385 [Alphaproteobacteria bacterium]|nr:hypothetical protein [Alphaproteobacteria bacterium]
MSPALRDWWRGELDRLSLRRARLLARDLQREFAILLGEIERRIDRRVAVERHRLRCEALFARHARRTAFLFGLVGRAMLAKRSPSPSAPVRTNPATTPTPARKDDPPRSESARAAAHRAFLAGVAEELVGAGLAGRAADAMMRLPAARQAAEARLAANGWNVARAIQKGRRDAALIALALDAGIAAAAGPLDAPRETPEAPAIDEPASPSRNAPPPPPSPPPPADRPPRGPGDDGGDRRRSFGERVEAHVRHWAPRRARRIAATSGDLIAQALAESARAGEAPEKAARRLRLALGGSIAMRRARVIARTEIGAAQNAAILFTAEGSPRRVVKIWAAIGDDRTRQTHRDADGQAQPLDAAFIVGRALLMHPGDPEGPAGEIINCRCSMLIEPRE